MTTSRMVAQGGYGSRSRQATGAVIGAVFGLVFVEANSAQLPGTWQTVARVGGAVVFVMLLAGIGRARRACEAVRPASGTAAFSRDYWLIVAAEAAALVAGLVIINAVFGAHELTVAWIALVVGVHFSRSACYGKQACFTHSERC